MRAARVTSRLLALQVARAGALPQRVVARSFAATSVDAAAPAAPAAEAQSVKLTVTSDGIAIVKFDLAGEKVSYLAM